MAWMPPPAGIAMCGSVALTSSIAQVPRVVGANLDTSEAVARELKTGSLTSLDLSGQSTSILLCADSQDTGAEQLLYAASTMTGDLSVSELAVLQGKVLSDEWELASDCLRSFNLCAQ